MISYPLVKVDFSALKANQGMIFLLNLLALVLNFPALSALVALIAGMGYVFEVLGFLPFYQFLWLPLGLLKPDVLEDHLEPHRFAQLVGFYLMMAGSVAHYLGLPLLGWSLIGIVVLFSGISVFGGYCVGCAVYYALAQARIPGFTKRPHAGTRPGRKRSFDKF
ncbi:MAG TPA: DUF4395 family protein [Anaerolineales bacterium]|nr:DUF4395 family protein [Anaerolineales bacterium]